MNLRVKDGLILGSVVLLLAPLLIAIFSNLKSFDAGMGEVAAEVWLGVKMLFFTGFILGIAYVVIRLRHMNRIHEVRPDKYGQVQGVVVYEGKGVSKTEHFNTVQTQMDLDMLRKTMQMLSANASMMKRFPLEEEGLIDGPRADQKALPSPSISISQIRLSEAVRKLVKNGLQVYWGRKENGEDCILSLPEATHTQKSGRTGLGKSYLTTGELYCLHTMNDPDVIQFAYIDLECETTEPFHQAPHTWKYTIQTGDKQEVRNAVVTDLDGLYEMFVAINQELAYRDKHKDENFPYLLVVVEEAEELIEALDELPKKDKNAIMRLWKRIARRGRKRRILLDINVQNTYTDPIMKTAQRQFQLKITAAQQPSTARAGGFQDLELLKRLEAEKRKGLFIVSHETGEYIILAPYLDVDLPDYDDCPTVESDLESRQADTEPMKTNITQFPAVGQQSETLQESREFMYQMQTQNLNNMGQVQERVPVTADGTAEPANTAGKYQFSTVEKPIVVKLYKKFGNIDDVLATFERGSRWHASASAILKEAGLL